MMKGEGESRETEEPENEKLRDTRNAYFVPIERLAKNAKPFAELGTLRYASILLRRRSTACCCRRPPSWRSLTPAAKCSLVAASTFALTFGRPVSRAGPWRGLGS
jgi:hypothetical protein